MRLAKEQAAIEEDKRREQVSRDQIAERAALEASVAREVEIARYGHSSAPAPRVDEVVVFNEPPFTVADSERKAKERYLFLINRADPRRKLYDTFLAAAPKTLRYAALSTSTHWPEFAADECARLYGWKPSNGDFKSGVGNANKKDVP